jgi:hypothetical protein
VTEVMVHEADDLVEDFKEGASFDVHEFADLA